MRHRFIMTHFKEPEFACRCGCGKGINAMSPLLLSMLERARGAAGIPFVITSAFRCPEHNRAVGGVEDSSHTRGLAVDIRCVDSHSRLIMLHALLETGFPRIELAPTWLHVDVDPDKPQNVAFYQTGGHY